MNEGQAGVLVLSLEVSQKAQKGQGEMNSIAGNGDATSKKT